MKKEKIPSDAATAPIIARIEIEDLFYSYSYKLTAAQTFDAESGRLILLCGNNGTGKTTILNLIYHLMHPKPYGGHRTFIGKVPFRNFRVYLTSGEVVVASRRHEPDPGKYEVSVFDTHGEEIVTWAWLPKQERSEVESERTYTKVCEFLEGLRIKFHYLSDTRRVEGRERTDTGAGARRVRTPDGRMLVFDDSEEAERFYSPVSHVEESIDAAVQWFRQKALSAANVGYTSVNSIYRDIIKRIAMFGASGDKPENNAISKLVADLEKLGKRNWQFAKLGLTADLETQDLIKTIQSTASQHVQPLKAVLGPYLEGQNARLDALEEVQRVMDSFIRLLTEFYSHKAMNIHIEHGLDIRAETGQQLPAGALSSGEKQLLLLFCNAISARQDRTILMIDEPEISLNAKWQRELIPALLTCMSGTAFQIILATHSIQLLARYREYVTPLDNILQGPSDE